MGPDPGDTGLLVVGLLDLGVTAWVFGRTGRQYKSVWVRLVIAFAAFVATIPVWLVVFYVLLFAGAFGTLHLHWIGGG